MIYDFKDLYVVISNRSHNPFHDIKKIFADYDEAAAFADNLNELDRIKVKQSNPNLEYDYTRAYFVAEFEETMLSLLENEYEKGSDHGYDKGYDEGCSSGNDDGYDRGFDDGKRAGYDDGYEDGKQESNP
jgi:flagellar biosynthesis/type III secretory pathway protein FliH